MVKVYTQNGCVPCKKTKDKMNELGIEFEELNVTENTDALKEVVRLGYKATPVVVVDEDTHWHGYNPKRIELLVEGKENN